MRTVFCRGTYKRCNVEIQISSKRPGNKILGRGSYLRGINFGREHTDRHTPRPRQPMYRDYIRSSFFYIFVTLRWDLCCF